MAVLSGQVRQRVCDRKTKNHILGIHIHIFQIGIFKPFHIGHKCKMNFILQYELFHLFYTFFADAEQDIRICFVEDRVDLGEHGGSGLRCVGNRDFTGAFF